MTTREERTSPFVSIFQTYTVSPRRSDSFPIKFSFYSIIVHYLETRSRFRSTYLLAGHKIFMKISRFSLVRDILPYGPANRVRVVFSGNKSCPRNGISRRLNRRWRNVFSFRIASECSIVYVGYSKRTRPKIIVTKQSEMVIAFIG